MTETSVEETRNLYLAILNPIYEALHTERTYAIPHEDMDGSTRPGLLAYATRDHVQDIVHLAATAAHDSVKAYLDSIKQAVPDLCRAAGAGGKVCIREANHEQRHRFGVPEDVKVEHKVITFSPIHTDNEWDKPGGSVKVRAGDMIRIEGMKAPVRFVAHRWNADNGKEWLDVATQGGQTRSIHPDKFKSKARVSEDLSGVRPRKVRKRVSQERSTA